MAETDKLLSITTKNITKLHGNTRNALLIKLKDFSIECLENVRLYCDELAKADVNDFDKLKQTVNQWSKDQAVFYEKHNTKIKEINNQVVFSDKQSSQEEDAETTESLKEQITNLTNERNELQRINKKVRDAKVDADNELVDLKVTNRELAKEIEELKRDQFTSSSSDENEEDDDKNQHYQPKIKVDTEHTLESTKSHTYKLDSSVKIFSGRGDIADFIFVADMALQNQNVPPNRQLNVMGPHFAGAPLQYLRMFISEGKSSWSDFKKILLKQYTPIDQDRKIKQDLQSIKHYGNFESFTRKFLLLINKQTTKMDEKDKIFHFVNALKAEAKHEVLQRGPKSLDQAIKIATNFEELKKESGQINSINTNDKQDKNYKSKSDKYNNNGKKSYKNNPNNTNKNTNPNRKYKKRFKDKNFQNSNNNENNRNNSNNRKSNNRPYNNNNNSNKNNAHRDYSNMECYNCHNYGHRARDCKTQINNINPQLALGWNDKKEESSSQYNNDNMRNRGINTISTIKFAPQINVLSIADIAEELPQIPAQIKGVNVTALLDTGASVCTLSQTLASTLNIQFDMDKSKIDLAQKGRTGDALGIAYNVAVKIFDKSSKINFLIMDTNQDLILGAPWFKMTCAGIFWTNEGEKVLRFSAKDKKPQDYFVNNIEIPEDTLNINEDELNDLETPDVEMETLLDDQWNFSSENLKIKTATPLTKQQQKRFDEEIVPLAKKCIAKSINDLPGYKYSKVKIQVEGEPVQDRRYRRSEKQRSLEEKVIKEMEDAGIIRTSRSQWCQNIFINAKGRLCLDSRPVNAITPKRSWPVPLIDDILLKASKFKYSTKYDFLRGFWQLLLDEESMPITAFMTSLGLKEFCRLPFGMRNALFEFQRVVDELFGDLDYVSAYVDDVTVGSETFEQHIEHLKVTLNRILDSGLKLNGEKTVFFATKIKLLGHIITHNQIHLDPAKIEPLVNRLPPRTLKDAHSWICSLNYYRKHIEAFARIAKPIYNLLTKGKKFVWDHECQLAFEQLIKILTSYPILRTPDLRIIFTLYCDSSFYAIGCILAQVIELEYVVEYASKLLKGAQLRWSITDKELYAIIWGIHHFAIYLRGVKFRCVTDHKALIYLKNQKDTNLKYTRYSVMLDQFDIEFVFRKGKLHSNVDILSRPVLKEPIEMPIHKAKWESQVEKLTDVEKNEINLIEDNLEKTLVQFNQANNLEVEEMPRTVDPWEDEPLIEYLRTGKFGNIISRRQINRIRNRAAHFKLVDDILSYRKKLTSFDFKTYPKIAERTNLILQAHNFGHFDAAATYNRLKGDYYWRGIIDDIIRFVKKCLVCARNKKFKFQEHEAMAIEVEGIGDRCHIDTISGLPITKEGYGKMVTFIEALTSNGMAYPLKTKTDDEIAEKFIEYCALFGVPKIIVTDNGGELVNTLMKKIHSATGVDHRVTAPYNARTNGKVERFNQTLIEALRCHCEQNPQTWPQGLTWVLWAYRTRINPTTGYSPFMLTTGREMNTFKNWSHTDDKNEALHKVEILQRAREIEDLINVKQQKAKSRICDAQIIQKQVQDARVGSRLRREALEPGTQVMIKRDGIIPKLSARFSGPFIVIRRTANFNYELNDILGNLVPTAYPLHKLKICDEFEQNVQEYDEIEEVLNHKRENDSNMYLVKWVNDSNLEWVAEENFNTMECINKYFDKLNNVPKAKKNWKKKINNINYYLNILFILFFTILGFADCSIIKDNFQYCNINSKHMNILNTNLICPTKSFNLDSQINSNLSAKTFIQAFVLSKMHNSVDGQGFQCSKRKNIKYTERTLFLEDHEDGSIEDVKLSRSECELMVQNKKCEGYEMNCIGKSCTFNGMPTVEYSWLKKRKFENYTCTISPIYITAKDPNKYLFGQKCLISEGYCEIGTNVIVWNANEVWHVCPFAKITDTFVVELNITKINRYYWTSNNKWLFSVNTDKFETCELMEHRKSSTKRQKARTFI